MKGEVARPGAGIQFDEGRVVRSERAFGGVETVDEDFVETKIGREYETIVGRRGNPVRVRPSWRSLFTLEPKC
jgi:hypothetical protein